MAQKKPYYYGKKYSSDDLLVDWIFRRFIQFLNTKVREIVLRRRIKDENGDTLDGWWHPDTGIMELNPAAWNPRIRRTRKNFDILDALIHELCHILFDPVKERHILQVEKILLEKLSKSQKRILRRFLPPDTGY